MRNLLSFGILFVFAFLLAGHFVAYEVVLHENRDIMLQSIKSGQFQEETETILLSKTEAKTCIDGDEVTFKNHRYDIVSIGQIGENLIVHALNDTMEDRLIASLNDSYDNSISNKSSNHKSPVNILNDFSKEYASVNQVRILSYPEFNIPAIKVSLASDKELQGFQKSPAQPPRA